MMESIFLFLGSSYSVTIVILAISFILAFKYAQKRGSGSTGGNLPPGPAGIPLLGVLPQFFRKKMYVLFTEWAEEYGDVVMYPLLGRRVIVLNSAAAVREAFVKNSHVTADRPVSILSQEFSKNKGIFMVNGHPWKEQRRFALSALRDFGMGKIRLEENILDETRELIQIMEDKNGEPFDPHQLLFTSICNIIFSMVAGKRFDHDDPVLHIYTSKISENIRNGLTVQIVGVLPWLRHLPGDLFKFWSIMDNNAFVEKGLQREIDEHKRTYDPAVTRDYIDAFITKMKEEENYQDSTFSEMQLLKILMDMFVAGSETTATTLRWAILYMVHNPDVQERLRKSVDKNTDGSLPSLKDKRRLVMLEATINEVLRLANLTPVGTPHEASEPFTVCGYTVPAKTMIMTNMFKIHMDPEIWADSKKFDPNRFIDDEEKLCKPDSYFVFGTGNRACIGESLAKMELFLIFGCLVKRFRFVPENEGELPSLEGVDGFVTAPRPFKIRALRLN